MDLKIVNGTVVTPADTFVADIGVTDGRIEVIARRLETSAAETIDATGLYVLPGGIDAHTHLDMPFCGTTSTDDFHSGTVAAACGGTTTIVDFAMQTKGGSLTKALEDWKAKASGKAVIDYGFHVAVTDLTDEVLDEMPRMAEAGVTSLKFFMAYKGALMLDDGALFRAFHRAAGCGMLPLVHAENGDVIDVLAKSLLRDEKTAPMYHAVSRPPEAEAEATARAISLAKMAGSPLAIVHMTCEGALMEARLARAAGQAVFAETCPQYLLLSMDNYRAGGFEGAKFVMSPPLRERSDQEALWRGLAAGDVQTVGSDHCPFNFKVQKEMGLNDFSKIPNGAPGIETRLPLMFSEGVSKRRMSINRLVEVCSAAPAKLFGIYPRKGCLGVGSDADIVLLDPAGEARLSVETLHQNVDYCPYEGLALRGVLAAVISRGRIVARNGGFTGRKGAGEFLKRANFAAP